MGMSIKRYFPASGTAGFDRIEVKGDNHVPRPPPNTIATTFFIKDLRCYSIQVSVFRAGVSQRDPSFNAIEDITLRRAIKAHEKMDGADNPVFCRKRNAWRIPEDGPNRYSLTMRSRQNRNRCYSLSIDFVGRSCSVICMANSCND